MLDSRGDKFHSEHPPLPLKRPNFKCVRMVLPNGHHPPWVNGSGRVGQGIWQVRMRKATGGLR